MIAAIAVLALHFIRVTTPDGLTVDINPHEIISLRQPREDDKRSIHGKVQCVIFLADGKYVGVTNECDEVRQLIHELDQE